MKLLIGSTNKGKVTEFKQLLEGFFPIGTAYTSLTSYPLIQDIEENGKSFLENSIIKVKNIFSQVQIPTLCDDSGIEIDALNKAPGIFSARYGKEIFGKDVDMSEVMKYILDTMKNVEAQKRTARFVCAVSFINAKAELYTALGTMEGYIADSIHGDKGFGYDPIFIPQGYTTTLATMNMEEKNSISHRKKALENLIKKISKEVLL